MSKSKIKFYCWWIALFVNLYLLNFSYHSNADEGVVLAGAWNLFNGQKIYTDFFSFIPPGSFYFVLALWKIFAPNYYITKCFSLLVIFLSAIGVYKTAKTISDNRFILLSPAFFLLASLNWQAINHNVYNLFFIVWSVYFFLKGGKASDKKNYIASGLLLGLASLFLLHKSLLIFFIASGWLLVLFFWHKDKNYFRSLAQFLFSYLIGAAPLFFFASPRLLYQDLIIYPLLNYPETNKLPLALLLTFLFLTVFLFSFLIYKRKIKNLVFLFCLQTFLLLSALPRPDSLHISIIIFPLLALAPLAFAEAAMAEFKTKVALIAPYALIFLLIFLYSLEAIISCPPFYFFDRSKILKVISSDCQQSKYIYAGPFAPELYFSTRKLQPTPFSFLITDQQTKEQFGLARDLLERNRPGCAVLNYKAVAGFKYDLNNPVDNFIFLNYHLIYKYKDILIYKINNPPTNN
jgi:hypothetical protein